MARISKKWIKGLFAVYCLAMLWLLFGQRWGQWNGGLSLEPLDTVRRYIWVLTNSTDAALLRHAIINLVGNVVMFVPLGLCVPFIWGKMDKFWRHFLAMLLIIFAIELLQLVTRLGSCDVDDLLLNIIGTTLGFLAWKVVKRLAR